jgi:predicted acetyltransferase
MSLLRYTDLMTSPDDVQLQVASPADADLLSNLIQLYAYDLSEIYSLELGADGRFAYDKLPLYFSEPDRRFPLLIRHRGALAGLAFVTRGSPASDDLRVHDVAEFFILRHHRRFGVGRRAAFMLWDRFNGTWTVRVSAGNAAGLAFWSRAVGEYSAHTAVVSSRPGSPHPWQIYFFESHTQ